MNEFPLWHGNAPFADVSDSTKKEHFLDSKDGIERLTDVVNPTVTFYPASGAGPHPAVLVCPGGGYSILAWNHEGKDIAGFFNTIGFSAFLLKYRCPDRRAAARADAARAMRFVRANASKFNIVADKLGILGFSAGAHLSALTSASADDKPYEPVDAMDAQPYRPNFTALIYPAYLADNNLQLDPEFRIDASVSPTFLLQAEDDGVHVENALAWFLELKRAGVKADLHVYAEGGHGYGILRTGNPISNWSQLASAWFRRQAGVK